MVQRVKQREITLIDERGTFAALLGKLYGEKEEYDFNSLASVRRLITNERARLIHTIKTKQPNSLYQLAKLSERPFRSVLYDVQDLVRFGIIEIVKEKKGKRVRSKPVLAVESLLLKIKF